jgi:O-succinylhomoserine sulfhydrylase
MLCFDLKGRGKDEAFRFIDALRLITPAGSLGDVISLIVHPSSTTHHSLSAQEKLKIGISDSTLRLSAGVEDPEDLLEDLKGALKAIS